MRPVGRTVVVCAIVGTCVLTLALVANSSNHIRTSTAPPTPSPSPIQLILDSSGPPFDRVAAIETLGLADPFPIVNVAGWINSGLDRNTRITIFVTNLQLLPGETAHDVTVNLIDNNNQTFDIEAEEVRPMPGFDFAQVDFRVPDAIATGRCTVRVKWHDQITNPGTMRIRPPKPIVDIRPIRDTIYVPDNCPRTFVIKNVGPQGSMLDYIVVDPNGWLEVQNAVGSLSMGSSATITVRIHPRLLGNPTLLPVETFIVVETPDALNYVKVPIGYRIKNAGAEALLGTWTGTWSGNSFGRNNPGQPQPSAPVSGTWILNLQAVDVANQRAYGTLTWNGTDAYWTYSGTTATPHPFIPNRTIQFNSSNTVFTDLGIADCNQGHRYHLKIRGAAGAPNPSDAFYGPTVDVELNSSGTAVSRGIGFLANPYNPANFDTGLSSGIVTGSKSP